MRHPFLFCIVGAGLLCLASWSRAQEVVPPEERDVIEPEAAAEPEAEASQAAAKERTEASEDHTVIPGDTLWDLCAKYLNNPWYWPRVWSYNPEISNPHWIYPGQLVRFYPTGELPSEIMVSREIEVPEPVEAEEVPENLVQLASGSRIVQARPASSVRLQRNAFVTPEEMANLGTLAASREEKQYLSEFDSIYLKFKDMSQVQVGKQFSIMRTVDKVHHPITGEFYGYYTKILGACQVISISDQVATAIVVTSLDPILRGDKIGPMLPELTKLVKPKPNGVELRGYIIGSAWVEQTLLGEHHIVFIDQGTQNGVQEGNFFDVVRREDSLFLPGIEKEENRWDKSLPMEIYGRIMIVDAREKASTGIVLASLRELHVGDRILMQVQ